MPAGLTEQQIHDLATSLQVGWRRYTELLGEPPHGTLDQIKAMLVLTPLESLILGIQNKVLAERRATEDRETAFPDWSHD